MNSAYVHATVAVTPELAPVSRRFPVGAECCKGRGTDFRVWAPRHHRVSLVTESDAGVPESDTAMTLEAGRHFSLFAEAAAAGTRYRFRLGERLTSFPIPPRVSSRSGLMDRPKSSSRGV